MMLLLAVQAAATWFLCGVIWIVQVVHYPLFAQVGPQEYAAYHRRHIRLITWIVAPAMLVEAVTALAMLWWLPARVDGRLALVGAMLVVGIWLSTATLQVPAHRRLAEGFDARLVQRLVRGNWVRTAFWTARGVLVLWMVSMVR